MRCVESVQYKLKINAVYSRIIAPTRGLRQGDLLSPYLFIICQEWFSTQISALQIEKKIEGVNLARGLPRMNHLLFADDCLLFIKAELKQLQVLKSLMRMYEKVARWKVNISKSEFFCSPK